MNSITKYSFSFYNKNILPYQVFYNSFGSVLQGRSWVESGVSKYRFGYQNQEQDGETCNEGNIISFKYRIEDSRLGRFISVDPLYRKYPFYSQYAFSGNQVIQAVEIEGLEPYILFKSEKCAAENFGEQFNGKSIILGVEFAANIYKKVAADGKTYYYYDNPNKGDASSSPFPISIFEWFIRGGSRTATIHSHGEYLPKYENNEFSKKDKENAESMGGKSYITTPNGSLKEYNPDTQAPTDKGKTVNTNMPSDPTDPDRKNKVKPVENPVSVPTTPIVPIKKPVKFIMAPIMPPIIF